MKKILASQLPLELITPKHDRQKYRQAFVLRESGEGIKPTARKLGVQPQTVRNWYNEADAWWEKHGGDEVVTTERRIQDLSAMWREAVAEGRVRDACILNRELMDLMGDKAPDRQIIEEYQFSLGSHANATDAVLERIQHGQQRLKELGIAVPRLPDGTDGGQTH